MDEPKRKILIVEDEEPFVSALSDKLSNGGFSIVVARDGEEGFDVAKKENPDLILLDILLPKVDGISLARKLKDNNFNVPIVFLTNLSDPTHIADALESGYHDYLVKTDWNINDLLERIKDILSKSK